MLKMYLSSIFIIIWYDFKPHVQRKIFSKEIVNFHYLTTISHVLVKEIQVYGTLKFW